MRSGLLCFFISLSFLGCVMIHPRVYTGGEIIKLKKGESVMIADHALIYQGIDNTYYQFSLDESPCKVTCRAKIFKGTFPVEPPILATFNIINFNREEIEFKVISFKTPTGYKYGEKLKPMKF